MTAKVLVAYASRHGTTREVADSVAATLEEQGHAVEVEDAGKVRDRENRSRSRDPSVAGRCSERSGRHTKLRRRVPRLRSRES